MSGRDKKRLAILGGAILVVVLLLTALAYRMPAPEVRVAEARRENLNSAVSSNGKVEPITPHTLRAQFATFVERIPAVEGQAVRSGQTLLVLDAAETRAELARRREELLAAEESIRTARAGGPAEELAQLASDIRKNEAERARLRKDREGLERLLAKQAATRDELDKIQLALDRAEADARRLDLKKSELMRRSGVDAERAALLAERARNEVRALEEKVRSAELAAPVDGTLYALPVKPGSYVRVGDLLAEVADLRRVRVRAFVDEPELGPLEQGQDVEITWDAAPSRAWRGKTEVIPKTVVARGSRSVAEVLCSVENEKLELLPNINVNVRIMSRQRANALVVPRGAVRGEGADRYVFVLDGSMLRRRSVRIGLAGATMVEIAEGLKEGEQVALPADVELRDGLVVRAVPS